MNQDTKTPVAALQLGFAGAIPFVAGALASLPLISSLHDWGLWLLLHYGAIILSFMGGVHWGAAMMRNDINLGSLGRSVLPSLLALPAIFFSGAIGLIILIVSFATLLFYDEQETTAGRLPAWYPYLRRRLTMIVIACLAVGVVFS